MIELAIKLHDYEIQFSYIYSSAKDVTARTINGLPTTISTINNDTTMMDVSSTVEPTTTRPGTKMNTYFNHD